MAINGPNINIEYDPSIGDGSSSGNENINYNKEYVFFKDITPNFLDSDRSDNIGFSNLDRLAVLLHSWGFSDVDISNITEWKISGKNQYTNDGPRLEWKGNLFVKAPGLDLLKCKNKNNTSFQICTDIKEDNYILLNTHASGYSETAWKWIHISEFGFAIRKDKCYLSNDKSTMNNIVEFMTEEREEPRIESNISENNKIFPETIINYTWPISSYYVPNYLINNNNINGWGNISQPVSVGNFDYRIYMRYITSQTNSNSVNNFNLLDEASIVIYSDMDENLSRDNSQNTIEYTNNGIYVNDICKLKLFNPSKDLLLIATSNGISIENADHKYTIKLTESGKVHTGNNFYPGSNPAIEVSIPKELNYNYYKTNFEWQWYTFNNIEKNTKYILKDVIKNKKDVNSLLINKINNLYTTDSIKITGKFSESKSKDIIKGNDKELWVKYKDCQYNIYPDMSFTLNRKEFTTNYGLHVKGSKETHSYDFNFLNNLPDSKIFQIDDSYSTYTESGYDYAARKSYSITRGYSIKINNNLLHSFSIKEQNNITSIQKYIYGQLSKKVYRKESLGFTDGHEYISSNSKLWAVICIKNYFVKNPLKYPTMKLYSSDNWLCCEILNSLNSNINFKYMRNSNVIDNASISTNNTKTLSSEYGWSSPNLIDESFIQYEDPLFGEQSIPFSKIQRKYNNEFLIKRYYDNANNILFVVKNNTNNISLLQVYNGDSKISNFNVNNEKQSTYILENYQSQSNNLSVKYYHPDQCKWITQSVTSIPTITATISETTTSNTFDVSNLSAGSTYTSSWISTGISKSDFDYFSLSINTSSGWSPTNYRYETRLNTNNKYEWRYILTWNGGGPSTSRGSAILTCKKYTWEE